MSDKAPGPVCVTKCGPGWIDTGTMCRSKSKVPAAAGVYVCGASDHKAAQAVLKTLSNRAIAKIKFEIDSFPVNAAAYSKVAELVKSSKIPVVYDASAGTSAYYYQNQNKLELGFTVAATPTKAGLIVHECTHAAFDAYSYSRATVATSEAAAYIAQCIFVRLNWPGTLGEGERLYNDDEKKDRVFEAAWRIAAGILKGMKPGASDYASLKKAIIDDPEYPKAESLSGWNGL